MKEYRTTSGRVELRGDAENQRIGGLAIAYYDGTAETEYVLYPGLVERIMPGAAARAVKEKDDVVALFNHSDSKLLGRRSAGTLEITETKRGLEYRLPAHATEPDTDEYTRTAAYIARDEVYGSSFGFTATRDDVKYKTEDGGKIEVREVHNITKLWDVSPVTWAAYQAASSELRSVVGYEEWQLERQREAFETEQEFLRIKMRVIDLQPQI